jgi:hypothetical protein
MINGKIIFKVKEKSMKTPSRITLVLCRNGNCEAMFDGFPPSGTGKVDTDALLPCGHKVGTAVFGATLLKQAFHLFVENQESAGMDIDPPTPPTVAITVEDGVVADVKSNLSYLQVILYDEGSESIGNDGYNLFDASVDIDSVDSMLAAANERKSQ